MDFSLFFLKRHLLLSLLYSKAASCLSLGVVESASFWEFNVWVKFGPNLRPLQVLIKALQGIHIYRHAHATITVSRSLGGAHTQADPSITARDLNKSVPTPAPSIQTGSQAPKVTPQQPKDPRHCQRPLLCSSCVFKTRGCCSSTFGTISQYSQAFSEFSKG